MKLYAYRQEGRICFETCQLPPEAHVTDLGTIELSPPKKTVTKEAKIADYDGWLPHGRAAVRFDVPLDAKNIKCTYEIEE